MAFGAFQLPWGEFLASLHSLAFRAATFRPDDKCPLSGDYLKRAQSLHDSRV